VIAFGEFGLELLEHHHAFEMSEDVVGDLLT
jgi:hypothetical protein